MCNLKKTGRNLTIARKNTNAENFHSPREISVANLKVSDGFAGSE
jgi:hypothetical protein